MDGYSTEVLAHPLALASVDTGSDGQAQLVHAGGDGLSAADGPGGAVEGGEDPVSGRLDPLPSMAAQFAAADRFVVGEQLPPSAIADRDGVLGRVHDVGEQYRCQHPVA